MYFICTFSVCLGFKDLHYINRKKKKKWFCKQVFDLGMDFGKYIYIYIERERLMVPNLAPINRYKDSLDILIILNFLDAQWLKNSFLHWLTFLLFDLDDPIPKKLHKIKEFVIKPRHLEFMFTWNFYFF